MAVSCPYVFTTWIIVFFASATCTHGVDVGEGRSIGWEGSSEQLPGKFPQGEERERWVEHLSWKPRASLFHNFLTPQECAYLIQLATPNLEKSTVVDSATGGSVPSEVRTSSGAFLARGQDAIVKGIEERIATFSFIPYENGEGLQILHYEIGQKYEAHMDAFDDEFNTREGGQRIATLLMYLSDVEEGGETTFPVASTDSDRKDFQELSECAKAGKAVRPKMGDALLFWSLKPDSTQDSFSLHGSCPVIKGSKWSATKWMRVNAYR